MKKLLLLFAVMLSTLGAWAQNVVTSTDANPKYYVIASYNRGGYLTNAGVGSGLTHVALSDAGYWYFEKANDNGGVYIVNKVKDGESKVYVGSDKKASTTSAVWYVLENGVNKKGFSISSTNPISGSSCIDANNNNTGVGSWSPSTSDWHGTTWVVCSTEDNTYNPVNLIFRTRPERYVTSISLESSMSAATPGNSTTINSDFTGDNGLAYIDLTGSVTMKAVAGETVTASIDRNGGWTNAYVYIDKDANGFTASYDIEAKTLGGDLMTFSFYSGDEDNDKTGVNSAGNELTDNARNTIAMPSFQAPSTPGTYRMRFKHDWNSINPNGGNANFNSNGGSIIDVTLEVVSSTIEVNYSFTWKGVEKFTQTATTIVGDEYPAVIVDEQFPFGITATKPEGTITELDVVDGKVNKTIELESNLPFVYAADYESVSNWYYLIFHANTKNPLYYDGTENVLDASKSAVDANNREAYAWSFVGDPFDGFKVVNKLAGSASSLNAVEGGAVVSEGTDNVFKLTASAHGTNGFFMQCTTGSYMQRFNKQGGKVVYWNGADAGSTFMVEVCDLTGATELQALIDQVKADQGNYVAGTTVGYLTQASVNAVAQAVTDAETYLASGSVTAEGSAEHQTAIDNAIDALETVQPEEGKFYTIQNAYSSVYMGVSNTTGMVTSATEGFGQVFQFVPASEGTFYLFNVERGAYLNTAKHHGYGQNSAGVDIAEAKSVTIANLGKENRVSITPQGGATLHHDANLATVVGWTGDANSRSAWKIVEVEDMSALSHSVTITDAGWATLVLGCNTAIPADVKAYAVSAVGDGYATLTEVTGTIPSNEAVLLNAVAGTYEFKYAEGATAVESNLLVGTVFDTNVAANAYVLSAQGEPAVVGFYKAQLNLEENTKFKNNAFKAYLPARAGGEARFLVFNFGDDNATAIEGIEAESIANAVVYDLAGRRVQKAQKGLYIVNGKKVIK